jgi:kinesin family protein 2/24
MNYIEYGTNSRVTAQNSTNVDSSRSHAILQITLKKQKNVHGKISFIDLAGSERAADHADQTDKQTRIDGA